MKTKINYVVFIVFYVGMLTFLLLHPAWSSSVIPTHIASLLSMEAQATCCVYLLHFAAFLPLGFCCSQISGKRMIWFWLVALLLYAFGTEFLQEYIPPRAFRYEDLTQDIAGIIVGLFFGYYLKHIRGVIDCQ
jgi:VanZ family protein